MLFVGTSIIHPSTEGVFLLCNILDLLIYSYKNNMKKFHFNYKVIDWDEVISYLPPVDIEKIIEMAQSDKKSVREGNN